MPCDPAGANPWIEEHFRDCVYDFRDAFGFSLGLLSILVWLTAQLPQFISNVKNQSSEALSIWFLVEWFAGDTLNLLGCLIQGQQLPTTTILAAYFVLMDVIMLLQYIYYGALQARKARARAKALARRKQHAHHHHHHHHRSQTGPPGAGAGSSGAATHGGGAGSGGDSSQLHVRQAMAAVPFGAYESIGCSVASTPASVTPGPSYIPGAHPAWGPGSGGAGAPVAGSAAAAGAGMATAAGGGPGGVGGAGSVVAGATAAGGGGVAGAGGAGTGAGAGAAGGWKASGAAAVSAAVSLVCVVCLVAAGPGGLLTSRPHSHQHPLGLAQGSGAGGFAAAGARQLLLTDFPADAGAASFSLPAASADGIGGRGGVGQALWRLAGRGDALRADPDDDDDNSDGDGCGFLNCDVALVAGTAMGYLSTCFYLASRVSQIKKNIARRSTAGLSPVMFMLTMTANLCTGISIVVRLRSLTQLEDQLPWMCGTFGTIALDCTLLFQTFTIGSNGGGHGGHGGSGEGAAAADAEGAGGGGGGVQANGRAGHAHDNGVVVVCAVSGAGAAAAAAAGAGSGTATVAVRARRGGGKGSAGAGAGAGAGGGDLEAPLLLGSGAEADG